MDPEAFREAVSELPPADERPEAPSSSDAAGTYEPSQAPPEPGQEPEDSAAPVPPPPNWDDPANPYRQTAEQVTAERDRLAQQATAALYQQTVAAWNQAEIEHQQRTSGMDAFEAREADRLFYKNRENGLLQAYNQLQAQAQQYQHYVAIQQRAQYLVAAYALPEDDAESLLAIGALDPSRMEIEARRRADGNKKAKDLEKRVQRLERGDERDARVRAGADRFGGGGGGSRPARQEQYQGTREELAAALEADGILDVFRRR